MTILSTWSFEHTEPIFGCGVDAERTDRFRDCCAPDGEPWTALFTPREVTHNSTLDDPALGFCAGFCSKEALIKALGVPIDYRQCELLLSPPEEVHSLHLAPEFCDEHGVFRGVARVMHHAETRECVVAVCVFRR